MEARTTSFSLAPCPSSSFLILTTLLFLPPVLASTHASAWLCCDMLFLHFYILLPKVFHPREHLLPPKEAA